MKNRKYTYCLVKDKYGIFTDSTKIFTEDNMVIDKTESHTVIDGRSIPHRTRTLLQEILVRKEERILRYKKQSKIRLKIAELRKQISLLESDINVLETERNTYQKEIDTLVKSYDEAKMIAELQKEVSGQEIEEMSFADGSLNCLRAKLIVTRSDRPLFYTFGFAYRKPAIDHQAIDKEYALQIIENREYLDISFCENEIHLNAFSSNDMF